MMWLQTALRAALWLAGEVYVQTKTALKVALWLVAGGFAVELHRLAKVVLTLD